MRNNHVPAQFTIAPNTYMYDVAGIYTLGSQPNRTITENCVQHPTRRLCTGPTLVLPIHDEGSSFITVKDNWTEGDKYLKTPTVRVNEWINNGPQVNDEKVIT